MDEGELSLRRRLGIPDDAERVLVFGESSHWDPNWLFTSDQYYRYRIEKIFDDVIDELESEPRRVFSIESTFFLRMYWENRPERHETLRQLINDGRLRLTGSGVTTPDMTLPDTEAIIRDYLLGQEWLRGRGIKAEPDLAYLPDDFGCSPALPSILRSLGIDKTGITRIDGMYFVGSDYRKRSDYPIPGSSAEILTKVHKTQDFVWRGPDGAEVLCHWNAFSYFQGDMLAHLGVIRWMGIVFGIPWRTTGHVERRIGGFIRQLGPLSLTPYMFCPIGCDFNGPIKGLVGLLDRYNARRYRETGVYAINAGMDDYLNLVGFHRADLPVLELDPNPYWMGFYSSRPEAKRRCNRIARELVLAERLSTFLSLQQDAPEKPLSPPDPGAASDLGEGWNLLVLSNHHDFITGTSPDRVWKEEQLPSLLRAGVLAENALSRAGRLSDGAVTPGDHVPPWWEMHGGELTVVTPHYRVVVSKAAGGCITSLTDPDGLRELLAGPANDLVSYKESGGLWRMGHEYRGGNFRQKANSSELPAKLTVGERDGMLEVRVDSELEGRPFIRWLWFRGDSPVIRMRIEGTARRKRTVVCRFPTKLVADKLSMDVPGGVVDRGFRKLFDPTFWPARSFVHVTGGGDDTGIAAFLGGPAAAAFDGKGTIEWVAIRNAPREIAFGFLPIASHPASGLSDEASVFDYAVMRTESGDWRSNNLPGLVRQSLMRAWLSPGEPDLDQLAASQFHLDRPQVIITAVKPAQRGQGVIVRLSGYPAETPAEVRIRCGKPPVRKAFLCDARERDIEELKVVGGEAIVPIRGFIGTVRLLFENRTGDA